MPNPTEFAISFRLAKLTMKDHDIATVTNPPRKKTKVFPLHTTSFEHYMLTDDRRDYPMSFVVQLELSGALDRESFEQSVSAAVERHPLLTAIIGPGKGGKDCWIAASNPQPHLDFGGIDDPIGFPGGLEYINIRSEVGLRIFVRYDNENAIVTTQFHHVACDGIGSYHFLGDLLFEYAKRTCDTDLGEPIDLPPNRLRARGKASYDMNQFRLANGKYQRTWDEALTHLVRSNVVLKTGKKLAVRPFPGIQSHTFDRSQYKQLRLAAQSNGQIINDMLVENLFKTLHGWNRERGSFLKRKHVSIMMPMNLREASDNDISACNIVAHAFIRRSWKQMQDKTTFRQQLASELLNVKTNRHKVRFMHMMAGGHYFYPRLLKISLDWKRNLATAILSNTGDPTKQFHAELPREAGAIRCGNLLLEDISGVPPLRPGTNATVSIFTYRRNLKICLRCDPNQFNVDQTKSLLDMYIENIVSEIDA